MKNITILDFKEAEKAVEIKTEAEVLVEEYFNLNEQIKLLTKRKTEINTTLKDNKVGNYKIGSFGVEVTEVNTTRFNGKKAKEFLINNGEDISDYENESSYKKLSVKRFEE